MKVVYVAHPLGAGTNREANRLNAQRWVQYLATVYDIAPVCDWSILAGAWDESHREKGMAIDLKLIERCDEVWLVGGRISAGMTTEKEHAKAMGKTVVDMTWAGYSVPDHSIFHKKE